MGPGGVYVMVRASANFLAARAYVLTSYSLMYVVYKGCVLYQVLTKAKFGDF